MFGASTAASQAPSGTSLFGGTSINTAPQTVGFGSTASSLKPSTGLGLFASAAPATSSTSTGTGLGLFGSTSTAASVPSSNAGFGLFGSTSNAPATSTSSGGLFGSTLTTKPTGTGLFSSVGGTSAAGTASTAAAGAITQPEQVLMSHTYAELPPAAKQQLKEMEEFLRTEASHTSNLNMSFQKWNSATARAQRTEIEEAIGNHRQLVNWIQHMQQEVITVKKDVIDQGRYSETTEAILQATRSPAAAGGSNTGGVLSTSAAIIISQFLESFVENLAERRKMVEAKVEHLVQYYQSVLPTMYSSDTYMTSQQDEPMDINSQVYDPETLATWMDEMDRIIRGLAGRTTLRHEDVLNIQKRHEKMRRDVYGDGFTLPIDERYGDGMGGARFSPYTLQRPNGIPRGMGFPRSQRNLGSRTESFSHMSSKDLIRRYAKSMLNATSAPTQPSTTATATTGLKPGGVGGLFTGSSGTTTTSTPAFGSGGTGLFGAKPGSSLFGSSTTQSTGFGVGAPSAGSFGAPATSTAGTGFGLAATSGGGFGSTPATGTTSGSLFGGGTSTAGGFGQTSAPGGFGSTLTSGASSTGFGGGFGAKPAGSGFGFGSSLGVTSTAATGATTSTGFGGFGKR